MATSPRPAISAIICTHNREAYLGAAIDSLLQQEFDSFEVIVVDNASRDRTADIVQERLHDPRLRYVYESQLGLSVARNTGANAAQADILTYLDDDAVASPTWLSTIDRAYAANEKLAIAGGRVSLIWPPDTSPPPWLSTGLAGNLGLYDLGNEPVSITNSGLTPRGLNYSIRRAFLDQVGGFDVNLGRVGTNLLSNEELHMTQLALKLGWQVYYLPDAEVAHNVAPERMQRDWFLRRGWWQGISECYRERLAGQTPFTRQLWRGSECVLRGLYKSMKYFGDPAERFENLVFAYGQIGYLKAAVQGKFSPPATVASQPSGEVSSS